MDEYDALGIIEYGRIIEHLFHRDIYLTMTVKGDIVLMCGHCGHPLHTWEKPKDGDYPTGNEQQGGNR